MLEAWIYKFEEKQLYSFEIKLKEQSIDQFMINLPAGVYSTLRTINNKQSIFQFTYHLNRLRNSFKLAGYDLNYPLADIKQPLRQIFLDNNSEELRIRLFIAFEKPNECLIITEPLTQPTQADLKNGVMVCTNHLNRVNPKAKLTSFLIKSQKLKNYCRENNFEESVMISKENELLEGLSSNFFAILNREIYTAEEEVLKGSVRDIVIAEAKLIGIPINFRPIKLEELSLIDEAFITSTSRGVLPVVIIDKFIIRNGRPGKITKILIDKFSQRILSEAELI